MYLFTLWGLVASQVLKLQQKAAHNNRMRVIEENKIKSVKREAKRLERKAAYEKEMQRQKEIEALEGDSL